jgi:hypothetical protein
MYLQLGRSTLIPTASILGIFDLDNSTWSIRTREFLERMEEAGAVTTVGEDLPRSFLLCQEGDDPPRVYISQFTTATLCRRAEGPVTSSLIIGGNQYV